MYDLVTFGETMIRMAAPQSLRLEQTEQLNLTVGGAESNVAINLSRLGYKTAWVSRVPDNPLGSWVVNAIRKYGVDTSHVQWVVGKRQGLYFIEYGANPRGTRVWYDRENSVASEFNPNDVPFQAVQESRWLHLTGISAALSSDFSEAVRSALEFAKRHHIPSSFDVNYRDKLWTLDEASPVLDEHCKLADYAIVALRDAQRLFRVEDDPAEACVKLWDQWGGVVVVTDGDNGVYAFDGNEVLTVDSRRVEVVDRLGAGDALASGIICRLLDGARLIDALQFGVALASLALTIFGDIALVNRQEVEDLLGNKTKKLLR